MERAGRRRGEEALASHIPASGYYVAGDSRHYRGLVALINSLRAVGHDQPIYIGDCGFTDAHRRRLEEHVTLVETNESSTPHVATMVAPLAQPGEVVVLIDADVIVTRPLTRLIKSARRGRFVAFPTAWIASTTAGRICSGPAAATDAVREQRPRRPRARAGDEALRAGRHRLPAGPGRALGSRPWQP